MPERSPEVQKFAWLDGVPGEVGTSFRGWNRLVGHGFGPPSDRIGGDGSSPPPADHQMLIVDDMDLIQHEDPDFHMGLTVVRERLLSNNEPICSELAFSTGVILAVKRR